MSRVLPRIPSQPHDSADEEIHAREYSTEPITPCRCCLHGAGTEIFEGGHDVGRNPLTMSHDELRALGHRPMPASKAIHERCIDCIGSARAASACKLTWCPTYRFRSGRGGGSKLKALRAHCLDCCNGSSMEVRLCTAVGCAHWPFRLGTSPWNQEKPRPPDAISTRFAARVTHTATPAQTAATSSENGPLSALIAAPEAGEPAPAGGVAPASGETQLQRSVTDETRNLEARAWQPPMAVTRPPQPMAPGDRVPEVEEIPAFLRRRRG